MKNVIDTLTYKLYIDWTFTKQHGVVS